MKATRSGSRAKADDTAGRMQPARAAIRRPFPAGHSLGQPGQTAAAMVGERGAAWIRRGLAVEEYRQIERRERVRAPARGVDGRRHLPRLQGHERRHVQRAEKRMHTGVVGDIDAVDRCRRQCRHRPHQIVARAEQRQHRPVVVRVGRHVENPYAARRSRRHAGVDDVPAPPLADVRNALQADHAIRLARQQVRRCAACSGSCCRNEAAHWVRRRPRRLPPQAASDRAAKRRPLCLSYLPGARCPQTQNPGHP